MTPFCDIDSDSIDAQAASWFARNRNDKSRTTRKQFDAWLATPAHAHAYSQFEQLWADLAQLQRLNKPVPLPVRKRAPWRPALAAAAAVLCALLASQLGAPRNLYQSDVVAQDKGMRTLALPDGSTLYVNANTRLRIDFSAHQRTLYLDAGQVYLDVAPDRERPLWVRAGDASVRVVGTAFDMRRSAQQLVVSVAHGQVAFEPDGKSPATLLGAQQQAAYNYASGTLAQHTLNPGEVADWRSGQLSFHNRELASLIDELSLYRAKPVLLADGPVARLKISGTLNVNDPDALLKALPALLPVKTVSLNDGQMRIEARR